MCGWNGVRSLIGANPLRCVRSDQVRPLQTGATRILNRNLSLHPTTITLCQRHQHELGIKRDLIRDHIRSLELRRRRFSTSHVSRHGHIDPPKPGEELKVTFIDKEGDEHTFEVAEGDNLLDIAQANDLEMEGACGGSCACSTCHVIVDSDEMYDKIPEATDDENDMLDLAFGLTETSRLGCQVKMTKELDGLVVKLPQMTRNMQASDFEKRS
ncbi:hypothetical protein Z517_06291 [Fonsecaea pedrosoi CBS 271.37]|uniref:2Fe-2S ferredoxin-type domain-containing protein n=1 Tax=Fonsecaea pedrosoi CBS 271.37 TaxID=1442368 RepID=A0A0D2EZ88_9EURO|nr:uncharacterized protein Z517_06291 [Fonsecaea pedrosoi CBS 271.37]KIW79677.1 hypothetical protein Z517_06291 [Fonsecaea pedrosoi CBS 271.37]